MTRLDAANRHRLNSITFVIGSLSLLFLLGTMAGCGGAKVIHATTHPSFTYSTASSGEIGILGITSVAGKIEQRKIHHQHLPALLAQSIHKKRETFKIFPPKKLHELLLAENYTEILTRYEISGVLDTSAIISLFNATKGMVRYIIIGRVERDELVTDFNDEDETVTKYKVTRLMEISMEIYDLRVGKQVFKSLIVNKGSKERKYTNLTVDESAGFTDACMQSCFNSIWTSIFLTKAGDRGYPPPPEIYEVADDIFDEFADILPTE